MYLVTNYTGKYNNNLTFLYKMFVLTCRMMAWERAEILAYM